MATMRRGKTLGLLGTGGIGGGWAARALHFGIDVLAADVKPEMQAWIRGAVDNAEGALSRLTFAPLPPKGTLSFTTDLRSMARQVDFIQENIPEQLELKQRVLADVSRWAAPDVLIASSTSGLMPSDLQRDMQAPERFFVSHPFNPVYLLPLGALGGGAGTPPPPRGFWLRIRSIRSFGCHWWSWWAGPAPRPRRSTRPATSTATSACMRCACGARFRAISPTGCRRRCGARFCTWSMM